MEWWIEKTQTRLNDFQTRLNYFQTQFERVWVFFLSPFSSGRSHINPFTPELKKSTLPTF